MTWNKWILVRESCHCVCRRSGVVRELSDCKWRRALAPRRKSFPRDGRRKWRRAPDRVPSLCRLTITPEPFTRARIQWMPYLCLRNRGKLRHYISIDMCWIRAGTDYGGDVIENVLFTSQHFLSPIIDYIYFMFSFKCVRMVLTFYSNWMHIFTKLLKVPIF